MANKITNAKALQYVLENCTMPDEVYNKLTTMLSAVENRTTNRKPSAAQTANAELRNKIYEAMEANTEYSVSNVKTLIPECADMNPQRIAPLLSGLVKEGRAVKAEGRKPTYRKI